MAKRSFNYVFEDLRRDSTPVRSDGFAETSQPAGDDVDVNLNEEDETKAVRRAPVVNDDDKGKPNGEGKSRQQQQPRDARREVLAARRAGKEAADESLATARREVATELGTMRKELDELKGKDELQKAEADYATRKADIEAQLVKAMEAGNHADHARLNSQLIELNNDLQRKRLEIKAKTSTAQVEDLNGQRGKAPLVRIKKFLEDNADWWADPEHEDAVTYAKKLDRKLTTELGMDPNSDRYWTVFNRNFDKKFPDLRKAGGDDDDIDLDGGDDPPDRGSARVVTPPTKGAGGGKPKPRQQQQERREGGEAPAASTVRLTAADKQTMRLFGLDPTNEEHLVEFARNKVPDVEE